jgi:uncharacterized tellurite resistance protein B-like protein
MLEDLARNERLRLMKFVCSFAWADLEVRPEERAFVSGLVRRLDLDAADQQQVLGWLEVPPRPESVDPTQIPTEHRRLFLDAIRGVIESDGDVAEEEAENLRLLEKLFAS